MRYVGSSFAAGVLDNCTTWEASFQHKRRDDAVKKKKENKQNWWRFRYKVKAQIGFLTRLGTKIFKWNKNYVWNIMYLNAIHLCDLKGGNIQHGLKCIFATILVFKTDLTLLNVSIDELEDFTKNLQKWLRLKSEDVFES